MVFGEIILIGLIVLFVIIGLIVGIRALNNDKYSDSEDYILYDDHKLIVQKLDKIIKLLEMRK